MSRMILLCTEIDWTPPPVGSPKVLGEFINGHCDVKQSGIARFICVYDNRELTSAIMLKVPTEYEPDDCAYCD